MSIMSDQVEETIDRIRVMLHLEEHLYACPNYFAPEYRSQSEVKRVISPVTVVNDECAKLMKDMSLGGADENNENSNKKDTYNGSKSPNDVRSRSTETVPAVQVPKVSADVYLIPWRCQMCSWAYTVIDTFGFNRSVVGIAFNILDRYLAKECRSDTTICRQDFQLFSMTAVYLAIKIYEPSCDGKLSLMTLVDMSRGYFTLEDFEETEMDILVALNWRLSPPTAHAFLDELLHLQLLQCSTSPAQLAALSAACHDILESTVPDAFFVPCKASLVATAAILVVTGETTLLHDLAPLVDVTSSNFQEIYQYLLMR